MAKKIIKTKTACNSYKHSNLMMVSTTLSICTLLVLMLISTAFKSTISSLVTARYASGVISALFFAGFVVLGFLSIKKDKSFIEYAIYSFVMSIGFLSLLGTPFFLPKLDLINKLFTTKYVQAGIMFVNVIYLVWALTYHNIKASQH